MITEGRLIICDRCKTERFFGHKSDGPLTNDPYSILNEWEACKEDFMEEGSNENNR